MNKLGNYGCFFVYFVVLADIPWFKMLHYLHSLKYFQESRATIKLKLYLAFLERVELKHLLLMRLVSRITWIWKRLNKRSQHKIRSKTPLAEHHQLLFEAINNNDWAYVIVALPSQSVKHCLSTSIFFANQITHTIVLGSTFQLFILFK